jgi:hypothetical protein
MVQQNENNNDINRELMETIERRRYIVNAKLNSAKSLSAILSTILIKKNMRAKFVLQHEGIKVITEEDSKSMQCVAHLKRDMFQSYVFTAEAPIMFGVQLSDLIDCLSIYGAAAQATSVHMVYPGYESTLSLLLSEGCIGVVTDCGLRTSKVSYTEEFIMEEDTPVTMRMESDVLREAINEVEQIESSIKMSFKKVDRDQLNNQDAPDETGIRLQTSGPAGTIEVFLPSINQSVRQYKCSEDCSHKYIYHHLQHIGKALSLSESTCIRVNSRGICSIQLYINLDKDSVTHLVEYILAPELSNIDSDLDTDMDDDLLRIPAHR